jgi:hypothetical protein
MSSVTSYTRTVLNRFHDCGKELTVAPLNFKKIKETVWQV